MSSRNFSPVNFIFLVTCLGLVLNVTSQQQQQQQVQFQNVNIPNRLLPFFQQPGVQFVQRLQRQFFQQQQQQNQRVPPPPSFEPQPQQQQINLQVEQLPQVSQPNQNLNFQQQQQRPGQQFEQQRPEPQFQQQQQPQPQRFQQQQQPQPQQFQPQPPQPEQNFQRPAKQFDVQPPQSISVQPQPQQQQQQVQQRPVRQEPMTEVCLACLCEASTSCNLRTQCVSEGQYCGPFLLSKPYWLDSGSPTLLGDQSSRPGAFEDCATDPVCSAQAVRSYMTKYMKDCNGDNRITCDDLGRIHLLGASGCSRSVNDTPFYQRFLGCLSKASRFSV